MERRFSEGRGGHTGDDVGYPIRVVTYGDGGTAAADVLCFSGVVVVDGRAVLGDS